MKDIIEFPVVGQKYLENISELVLEEGQVLILEADPTNTADGNAIKVLTNNNIHLGYVPNRGTSCSLCWTAVPANLQICPGCSADWGHFVLGGLATRLTKTKVLEGKYACYVKTITDKSSFSKIVAKLVILD